MTVDCAYCDRTDPRPFTFVNMGTMTIDGVTIKGNVCHPCWVAAGQNAAGLAPTTGKGLPS